VKLQKEQAKDSSADSRREGPGLPKGNGTEMRDWFESLEPALEFVLKRQEPLKTARFLDKLVERLREAGVKVPHVVSTPYINTIPVEKQPSYPGD
jgi:pyruvate dehydrogenase E1 component